MTYLYQQQGRYFAQVGGGLENVAVRELQELNLEGIKPGGRGVYFETDRKGLYRVNYQSRIISRVLAPLMTFRCHTPKYLYRRVRDIPWHHFFSNGQTFAVQANVANSRIRHSGFAALTVKDGVVDAFRDVTGERPNVDPKEPDVWLNLHIVQDEATISLDTSGHALHKRGYRKVRVHAPMQETLAAAMVRYADWDRQQPLYDPMCGGGTLLCEALMAAARIPAAYLRPPDGFKRLPDYSEEDWQMVKLEVDKDIQSLPEGLIAGSDIDGEAVKAAQQTLAALPGGELVRVKRLRFEKIEELSNRIVLCNPPYGVRMQKKEGMDAFIRSFGDFLKQRAKGTRAIVYFGRPELLKCVGLQPAWKKALANGGLDGRLARFDVY